jgi:hypothetical protein
MRPQCARKPQGDLIVASFHERRIALLRLSSQRTAFKGPPRAVVSLSKLQPIAAIDQSGTDGEIAPV